MCVCVYVRVCHLTGCCTCFLSASLFDTRLFQDRVETFDEGSLVIALCTGAKMVDDRQDDFFLVAIQES